MSWYQEGLIVDLATLDGTGAMRAMLLAEGYEFDPAHVMADVELVEASGGAYGRIDVPDVEIDVDTPAQVRLLSPTMLSIRRPATAFGWLALYRASDDALILAVPVADNLGDPVEMMWADDVIGCRAVSV